MRKKDRGDSRERSASLQRKHQQHQYRRPWQLPDREVRHDRRLPRHEEVEDVARRPLVRLMDDAEHGEVPSTFIPWTAIVAP